MQTLRRRFVSESLIFSNLLAHSCRTRFLSSRSRNLAEIIGTRGRLLLSSGVDRGGPNMSESSSLPELSVYVLRGGEGEASRVPDEWLWLLLLISLLLSSDDDVGVVAVVSIRSISSTSSPALRMVTSWPQLLLLIVVEPLLLLLLFDALSCCCVVFEAVVMTTSSQFCVVGNVMMSSEWISAINNNHCLCLNTLFFCSPCVLTLYFQSSIE